MKCPVSPSARLALAEALWGWKPHPTQKEWLLDDHPVKVAACGRRWGKTESAVIDNLTLALSWPGCIIMVIAPTRDQVMILFKHTKRLVESTPDLTGSFKIRETPHPEITIADSSILFRTAGEDGKNIRGHHAHRIMIDEAAYVKDALIEAVIEPMLLDFDGQLILQGTPYGKNHFYERFVKGSEPNKRVRSFTFPSCTNPHISAGYLEEIKAEHGETSPYYQAEYMAVFIDVLGSVFAWEDITACLYDPADYTPKGQKVCGLDVALHKDYTCLIVGTNDKGMLYITHWDRFNRIGWAETKARVFDFLEEHKPLCVMDATHGNISEALYEELTGGDWVEAPDRTGRIRTHDGLRIIPVSLTNSLKANMIRKLQTRLAQRLLRIPAGFTALLDEMKYFGFKETSSGNVRYEGMGNKHDDTVITLALMMSQIYGSFAREESAPYLDPMSIAATLEELEEERRLAERMIIGNKRYYD